MMLSPADIHLGLLCIGAGLMAGYMGALFGVGGGTILVPLLLFFLMPFAPDKTTVMHCALGTSLALTIPNGLAATRQQLRSGSLDLHEFKRWIPFVMGGAVMGAILVRFCSPEALRGLFTGYLFACALFSAVKHRILRSHEVPSLPRSAARWGGVTIGGISVLLGVGGGTFIVPFCQALRYSLKKSIALSSATTVFIGLIGAVGAMWSGLHVPGRIAFSVGYVNWLAFLIVTPFIVIASSWGVHTANKLPAERLTHLYTLFLLMMGIALLVE